MKIVKKVKIKNDLGLHVRPATTIVKMLQASKSSVFFTYRQATINARSIMGILALVAKKNTHLEITVEGEDAQITMALLLEVFENRFDEEDKGQKRRCKRLKRLC